jgi:uncharacterized protein YndB with AHSA1/START domain
MLATITKTKDGYEAKFERKLRHPAARVWKAISDPKEVGSWFVRAEIEQAKGGRYTVHHDHVGMSVEEEVLRFEPPRVLEHTWGKESGRAESTESVLWEVHPEGQGTRLVVTYRFRDLAKSPGSLAGWHVWLDVLEAVMGGESRADHEPPHATVTDGKFTQTAPGKGLWQRNPEMMRKYGERVRNEPIQHSPGSSSTTLRGG